MHGLIHIYTGEGKGKTTASIGLSIRFAGNGGSVLFTQFLKAPVSSELAILSKLDGIRVFSCAEHFGFSYRMTPEQKELARRCYTRYFHDILSLSRTGDFGLLVLDEILAADRLQFIPHMELLDFLKTKPETLEVVLTGREPSPELLPLADYISQIQCVRHPYEKGISARDGIER